MKALFSLHAGVGPLCSWGRLTYLPGQQHRPVWSPLRLIGSLSEFPTMASLLDWVPVTYHQCAFLWGAHPHFCTGVASSLASHEWQFWMFFFCYPFPFLVQTQRHTYCVPSTKYISSESAVVLSPIFSAVFRIKQHIKQCSFQYSLEITKTERPHIS